DEGWPAKGEEVKVAVFDTEGLGDAIDDFAEASGADVVHLDSAWQAQHGGVDSPAALRAAIRSCIKQGAILLVDSATDVCEQPRTKFMLENPRAVKPDYQRVDLETLQMVAELKSAPIHWVITMREKDEKGPAIGGEDEITIGKRGKAAKDLDYAARFKLHCQRGKVKGGKMEIYVDVQDQRGLGEQPAVRLTMPKSADFDPFMERYSVRSDRWLHASLYGREGSGKSGTAMRMVMSLLRAIAARGVEGAADVPG